MLLIRSLRSTLRQTIALSPRQSQAETTQLYGAAPPKADAGTQVAQPNIVYLDTYSRQGR